MKDIPTWEPLADDALADQRGTYDRMRAACPLARSPRGVTLFRHADVVAAALDPTTFSSEVSAHRQIPNSLDPPEHTAFRAVIDPFFTPDRMRALEPRLREQARNIVAMLPRAATVAAGSVAFAVQVTSAEDDQFSQVEEGTVQVGGFSALSVKVVPRTSQGKRTAKHRVEITNSGNAPLHVTLDALDPDAVLAQLPAPLARLARRVLAA